MGLTQVKTSGLADDAVTSAKIADDAVVTAAIADDAVTGANIADDTVAEANMANDAISLTELKAGTDGQIITWDASGNPVAVGPGTDGQVLTSTGAGSPPAFETVAPSSDTLSFRNLIINGACNVAQRGTSSTGTSYQTTDRHNWGLSGHSVTVTQSQHALTSSDTGPWEKGFKHSAHIALSGAGTMAANTTMSMFYKVEAQDMAKSGWDYTSSSSNITISFWCKVSTAQTFYLLLFTTDGTAKSIVKAFTPGNTNWNKFTFTIPGHADLQFDNNADVGLSLAIVVTYGTDKTGSGDNLDSWGNYNSSERVANMASTWLTAGASTFEFTGLQLEVGSSATEFEHRSYADELRRCMRYCQITDDGGNGVGVATGSAAGQRIQMDLKEIMRSSPTITKVGNNIYVYDGTAACQVSSTSAEYGTPHSIEWEFSSVATGDSLTAGRALVSYINGSSGGFKMDAEM